MFRMGGEEGSVPLSVISDGSEAEVVSIEGGRRLRARLKDLGLKERMRIRVLHSHGRGSIIVRAGDTRLVLGRGMAYKILVRRLNSHGL